MTMTSSEANNQDDHSCATSLLTEAAEVAVAVAHAESQTSPSTTTTTTIPITVTKKKSSASSLTSPLSTWTLPIGIEDDIEQALLKTAMGVVAGGLLGVVFMRSGNGRRATAVATGLGVAVGSTYERVSYRIEQQQQKEQQQQLQRKLSIISKHSTLE
mmetsp:Transcript_7739/g.8312  ORF Transcript_7739/g.8312 Transcript_7739/m.8312 type:complete len:158 (-) Transcript_7739:375-848(-)